MYNLNQLFSASRSCLANHFINDDFCIVYRPNNLNAGNPFFLTSRYAPDRLILSNPLDLRSPISQAFHLDFSYLKPPILILIK